MVILADLVADQAIAATDLASGKPGKQARGRLIADNAMAESLFATLECELFDRQPQGRFETHQEAKLAIFDYLEAFYNQRRRHSALGQMSPAAFEAAHTVSTAA